MTFQPTLLPIIPNHTRPPRNLSRRLLRAVDLRVLAVKDDGHLLEGVAAGLGVVEICCQAETDEDGHEDEVVFPADCFEGDGVDESGGMSVS